MRTAVSQVKAAFFCPTCHWAEDAETLVHRRDDNCCPRCLTDGMEVATDREDIEALHLVWCETCRTWHNY